MTGNAAKMGHERGAPDCRPETPQQYPGPVTERSTTVRDSSPERPAPYYQDETLTLWHGDCLDVMGELAPASIDAVITSPPYAMQRDATYGGVPESDYPAWTVAWMSEVRRILKPNGSAVINIRPSVRNGQIGDYTLRTRLALRGDGWAEIEELIWHKKGGAPLGSVHRPRRSWESLHWFALHGQPFCDPKAAGAPTTRIGLDGGRVGPHIGKMQQRPAGGSRVPTSGSPIARVIDVVEVAPGGLATGDACDIAHPAQYPWQLAEWVAHLVCPPGGTILDPFSGSGSTGVAALRNGWKYVGIDAVIEYVAMSERRLAQGVLDFGGAA